MRSSVCEQRRNTLVAGPDAGLLRLRDDPRRKQNPRIAAGAELVRQRGKTYFVGAMAGVLELSPAFGFFLAPFTLAPLFSASILPVVPAPGVGAMLGVLELSAAPGVFFAPLDLVAFALVPAVSAFESPPGFGCIDGVELDWA